MKKSTVIFLVGALALVLLVPLIVLQLAPSGSEWLRGALFTARDVPDQAVIARKLARNGSAASLDALTKFAATRRHAAFDRARHLLLLYEAGTRRTHVAGPIDTKSFVIGDPPVAFLGVVLVESLPERTTFLLKQEADGAFRTVQFAFAGDTLVTSGFYDPDPEQLAAWKRTVTWPAGW